MKSRTLSKHEIKEIKSELEARFGVDLLNKKDRIVLIEDEFSYIKVNENIDYFYHDDMIVPTLKNILRNNFLKKIIVDMGAVKFVVSGADIMRPGIREIDINIEKDDVVVIVDEKNMKPLALGISLLSGKEMEESTSGKCIKNIHYVGDKVWEL